MINDPMNLQMVGNLKITDKVTGEVLVKKKNAIHPGNMSYVIACALAAQQTTVNPNGDVPNINWMAFGNGGSTSTTTISYKSPMVSGIYDPDNGIASSMSKLYNMTYSQAIEDTTVYYAGQDLEPTNPGVNLIPENTSKLKFIVEVSHDGMATQTGETTPVSDSSTDVDAVEAFTIDEIGLVAGSDPQQDLIKDDSLLLTHVTFHPVLLSANRTITIEYNITITIG